MPLTGQNTRFSDDTWRNRPFEAFTQALAAVVGLTVLFPPDTRPESIATLLPGWLSIAWGICMLLGGVVGLAGMLWRGRPLTSYAMERIGLVLSGASSLIYGFVVLSLIGLMGAVAGVYTLGFSAACFYRCWTLREPVRVIKEASHRFDREANLEND